MTQNSSYLEFGSSFYKKKKVFFQEGWCSQMSRHKLQLSGNDYKSTLDLFTSHLKAFCPLKSLYSFSGFPLCIAARLSWARRFFRANVNIIFQIVHCVLHGDWLLINLLRAVSVVHHPVLKSLTITAESHCWHLDPEEILSGNHWASLITRWFLEATAATQKWTTFV